MAIATACSSVTEGPQSPEQDVPLSPTSLASSTIPPPQLSTTTTVVLGGVHLSRVDPATLRPIQGSQIGPVGWRLHPVASHGNLLAAVAHHGSNAELWSLVLINLSSGTITQLLNGGLPDIYTPTALAFDASGEHLLWTAPRRGSDPNFADGFQVHRYRLADGVASLLLEFQAGYLSAQEVVFLDGGRLVAAYGVDDIENRATPRVVAFNLEAGEVLVDRLLETTPPLIDVRRDRSEWGWSFPAWDDLRDRVYLPHVGSEAITTVDLRSGEATTLEVSRPLGFWGRLLAAWVPPAYAKGPSSYRRAILSPDGSLLYLSGSTIEWSEVDESGYREVPAGITAVDPESFTEVARTDLPLDTFRLSPDGRHLLASGSWEGESENSLSFGSSGVHLLDARTLDVLFHLEPSSEDASYEMAYSPDGRYGYLQGWWSKPYQEGSFPSLILDVERLTVAEAAIELNRFDPDLLEMGLLLDNES